MKYILTMLALLAAPVATHAAHAQLDGRLGKSSTGSLNFNLNVTDGNRVQISGFNNLTQSVVAGEKTRRALVNHEATGSLPCISADLPDTTVALDWMLTPLADLSDPTKIVPITFQLYKNAAYQVDAGIQIVEVKEADSLVLQKGTVTGVATKTGGHGTGCLSGNTNGALELHYRHGSADSRSPDTAGTYVSTITITVRPE